jgi:4-oxalocrotonate tautomerase
LSRKKALKRPENFSVFHHLKRRVDMPYVSIRVAGTLTRDQKKKIVRGVTDVIAEAAGKPKESILIFIDEESRENIAKGGLLLDE